MIDYTIRKLPKKDYHGSLVRRGVGRIETSANPITTASEICV